MFTEKGFSERISVMHLNKRIFRSQSLQKYLTHDALFFFFFSERGKFLVDTKNGKKMQQKVYGFLDHVISMDNRKFSLLLREYS